MYLLLSCLFSHNYKAVVLLAESFFRLFQSFFFLEEPKLNNLLSFVSKKALLFFSVKQEKFSTRPSLEIFCWHTLHFVLKDEIQKCRDVEAEQKIFLSSQSNDYRTSRNRFWEMSFSKNGTRNRKKMSYKKYASTATFITLFINSCHYHKKKDGVPTRLAEKKNSNVFIIKLFVFTQLQGCCFVGRKVFSTFSVVFFFEEPKWNNLLCDFFYL